MVGEKNYEVIGVRPGEKMHEVMIPKEESLNCIDMGSYYIIQPMFSWWNNKKLLNIIKDSGKCVSNTFEYSSDNNAEFLSVEEITRIINN